MGRVDITGEGGCTGPNNYPVVTPALPRPSINKIANRQRSHSRCRATNISRSLPSLPSFTFIEMRLDAVRPRRVSIRSTVAVSDWPSSLTLVWMLGLNANSYNSRLPPSMWTLDWQLECLFSLVDGYSSMDTSRPLMKAGRLENRSFT
jgi:hypothetical protein